MTDLLRSRHTHAWRNAPAVPLHVGTQTRDHLPIIAMTAHVMPGDRERCLTAGMDGFIGKPVQSATLFETLAAVVGCGAPTAPVRAPVPTASSTPIDAEALLAGLEGDRDLALELVDIFQQQFGPQIEAVQIAVRDRDAPTLAAAAHRLKGSLGTIQAS